ncbi:hypothetical protein PPTG_24220 [Phytophthora nicotianae INRA-310]|uniref:Uncharacterized protein n=2 Tax=Phytophthora nicotianae TaxID=4792 RepID=W2PIK8_PHYN3|nr:hypothetical protein PPTG_24220 [Phytophthora nicotianae INRA-310]ETI33356.1 hypothetical protein F443_19971 [Phytophthora nicotianae P1569]ETN00707.1 hypothetical protein PPTG_24220 [Phytophthora nicotianae INRA-310]
MKTSELLGKKTEGPIECSLSGSVAYVAIQLCTRKLSSRRDWPASSFTLHLARGGPKNECLKTYSDEYNFLRQHQVPSSIKAMTNEKNKIDPGMKSGDPALDFPTRKASTRGLTRGTPG